jgi:regulator of replication initiation timing
LVAQVAAPGIEERLVGYDYERPWGEMAEINELVDQLRRMTEHLTRAYEESAAFRQRTKELQKENENLRVKVAEAEGFGDLFIATEACLQDTEDELDRHKEYMKALAATMMQERRQGPALGAPGTEKLKHVDSTDGRVVVYPRPPVEEPPGGKGVPFVVDGLDFSALYRDGRDL